MCFMVQSSPDVLNFRAPEKYILYIIIYYSVRFLIYQNILIFIFVQCMNRIKQILMLKQMERLATLPKYRQTIHNYHVSKGDKAADEDIS